MAQLIYKNGCWGCKKAQQDPKKSIFAPNCQNTKPNTKNVMEILTNCFYCQSLGNNSLKIGRCAFCGVNNPLYLVNYRKQANFFCCGCAWWQFPQNEQEKKAESQWYQNGKKSINVN